MILERVTRKPLAEIFVEQIFEPLGLEHTLWPTGRQLPDPHADGITVQTPDGRQADATNWNPSWAFSAGALASTLDDMHVWIRSYATGSLVSPAMQKQRLTWVTFPPNTRQKAYGLGIGHDNGWLGHTGELPGYNTAAYYLPARKAAIVVMVNSDVATGGQNPAPALVKALTKIVTPGNVPI
jgi:D-alanyl-D-alanine carboxypeptidase